MAARRPSPLPGDAPELRASAMSPRADGPEPERDAPASADDGDLGGDILDVEGASADLGKTAGKDAASGKPTYPSMYGVDVSRRMAKECLDRAETRLASAGVADQHLLSIGRWIVERSN